MVQFDALLGCLRAVAIVFVEKIWQNGLLLLPSRGSGPYVMASAVPSPILSPPLFAPLNHYRSVLSISAPTGQSATVFATVFVLVWCGAAVVTVNTQSLGGKMCVEEAKYIRPMLLHLRCVRRARCDSRRTVRFRGFTPTGLSSKIRPHLLALSTPPPSLCRSFFQSVCVLGYCICPLVIAAVLGFIWSNTVWRACLVCAGLVWSVRASVLFMSGLVPEEKRALAVYPACLFYIVIGWIVYIE